MENKFILILLTLFLVTITGCESTLKTQIKTESTPEPQTDNGSEIESVKPEKTWDSLLEAIQLGISDAELMLLMELGADLNQMDADGITPFMALVATRSPEMVRFALLHGADVNKTLNLRGEQADVIDFTRAVHELDSAAVVQLQENGFDIVGTDTDNDVQLESTDAAQLVEKFALLKTRQFEQAQLNNASVQKIQVDFEIWSSQTRQRMAELSAPVPDIAEPRLPPVQSYKKSPFESLKMFQVRMDEAKQQRDMQTSQILDRYRKRVETRNQLASANSIALKKLKLEISQYNAAYRRQLDQAAENIPNEVQNRQPHFIAEAMAEVYGAPYLSAIEEEGVPKYDAERGLMFAKLGFSHLSDVQQVVLPVKAGQEAETFYQQLKQNSLQPQAQFRFDDNAGNRVTLSGVKVSRNDKVYHAKLGSQATFIAQAPVEVVLQQRDTTPQLVQNQLQQVVFDQTALNNLVLQNPNIKDVQFEAFLMQEQIAFKDDVPQLLAQVTAASVDRSQWLFVIGIGEYEQTDDILYSKRSAELFSRVMSKTLGIHESRKVVLLDKKASSGAIQDQLRLMLDKVKLGDKIVFYYSGHGLPVAEKGNTPYLLPADKIPDFIASDDFYQVQSIYRLLNNSKASQVIAFMDSCFTGTTDGKSIFGGNKAATRLQPKKLKIASTDRMAVFTAGTDKQFSNALPETGHRLFSYYLMKAMLRGYDRLGDLTTRVTADVNEKSLDLGGLNRQTPVLVGNPNLTF